MTESGYVMEILVTSRSTFTALPEVAFAIGSVEVRSNAINMNGTLLPMGLNEPQLFKEYDTFAILLQFRLWLIQV